MAIRRRRGVAALALLTTLGAGAVAGLAGAGTTAATVKVAPNGALGSIVVGSTGLTLYHLTSEKKGSITCTGLCATEWPPLIVSAKAKPLGGTGITSAKLGTIERPDGRMQVTYAGFALYRFAGDKRPGQANGEGLEKTWFAVTPAGKLVKGAAAAPTSSPSSPSAPSVTTVPSDGSPGY